MLHEIPRYQSHIDQLLRLDDITMVLSVRAHARNPWILDRLARHADWYAPRPRILVMDFGSRGAEREAVERICVEQGLEYRFEPDFDTFSLARARNLAFAAVETELVLFNDVDCFGSRDFFSRLLRTANAMRLGSHRDQMINLPVYHLNGTSTARVISGDDAEQRDLELHRISMNAKMRDFGVDVDFVAPYSNVFACHRDFFDLVGGYNESFRGHGSEDFELLLRFCLHAGGLPLPDEPACDRFGPLRREFFGAKEYTGFRRLFEALSFQAETEGLRVYHLDHPKPADDASGWYSANDWKRERFSTTVASYLERSSLLLARDWLPRPKRCLALLKHEDHANFFVPLRLAGYRLDTLPLDVPSELARTIDRIEAREFDAVAIFNPYMHSHAVLRPFFELAKKHGASPIVIERGALPESWYYAHSVSYDDPEIRDLDVKRIDVTDAELEIARGYREQLAQGGAALETQQPIEDTRRWLASGRRRWPRKRVLVPLQLDDDMAVTRFTDGFSSYTEFTEALVEETSRRRDVLFYVKPHPLSKLQPSFSTRNVQMCTRGENIHALIDEVDVVVCYNSGVGLLAALQGKRVITVGNAFYNRPGIGERAVTLSDGLDEAMRDAPGPATADLDRLLAWFLFRKYSFFKARSIVREFETRRSHGYRDQRFYALRLPSGELDLRWARAAAERPLGARSYAAGRLGTEVRQTARVEQETSSIVPVGSLETTLLRKTRKLVRDPERFFEDSRHRLIRALGERIQQSGHGASPLVPSRSQREETE